MNCVCQLAGERFAMICLFSGRDARDVGMGGTQRLKVYLFCMVSWPCRRCSAVGRVHGEPVLPHKNQPLRNRCLLLDFFMYLS